MKKIYILCLLFVLLFVGCTNNISAEKKVEEGFLKLEKFNNYTQNINFQIKDVKKYNSIPIVEGIIDEIISKKYKIISKIDKLNRNFNYEYYIDDECYEKVFSNSEIIATEDDGKYVINDDVILKNQIEKFDYSVFKSLLYSDVNTVEYINDEKNQVMINVDDAFILNAVNSFFDEIDEKNLKENVDIKNLKVIYNFNEKGLINKISLNFDLTLNIGKILFSDIEFNWSDFEEFSISSNNDIVFEFYDFDSTNVVIPNLVNE